MMSSHRPIYVANVKVGPRDQIDMRDVLKVGHFLSWSPLLQLCPPDAPLGLYV